MSAFVVTKTRRVLRVTSRTLYATYPVRASFDWIDYSYTHTVQSTCGGKGREGKGRDRAGCRGRTYRGRINSSLSWPQILQSWNGKTIDRRQSIVDRPCTTQREGGVPQVGRGSPWAINPAGKFRRQGRRSENRDNIFVSNGAG